jgi:hypothetical protein
MLSDMLRAGAVLTDDNDKYMMIPCGAPAWLVVQLSEEVLITKVYFVVSVVTSQSIFSELCLIMEAL